MVIAQGKSLARRVYGKGSIMIFKVLTKEEEKQFRAYAQENDPPDMNNWFIYHPVCREEWIMRGIIPQKEEKI